jgi:ribosomal-protein-alanine N-acetyltransferase
MTQPRLAPMTVADIPQVLEIDRLSFPLPWSEASYRHELTANPAAHFLVLVDPDRQHQPGAVARLFGAAATRELIGFGGFWFIVDEAHISTIAIRPEYRRRRLGEQLLVALLARALNLGAVMATLEVRVSNAAAQQLYRKYGFGEVGRRRHYYRDNGEDALLLTVYLDAARREQVLAQNKLQLTQAGL